jgi:hypothetical protein
MTAYQRGIGKQEYIARNATEPQNLGILDRISNANGKTRLRKEHRGRVRERMRLYVRLKGYKQHG